MPLKLWRPLRLKSAIVACEGTNNMTGSTRRGEALLRHHNSTVMVVEQRTQNLPIVPGDPTRHNGRPSCA